METVVQILDAEELAQVMYIPAESVQQSGGINREIMRKFLKAAELGEAKEYLKKKLAEGVQFDFDAPKLINGTMTEADWQNLYILQKQARTQAVEKNGKADHV